MATLPYMQLHFAEYLADTVHLQTDEHGAYLLLMINYWQTEKPLPISRLQAITRLSNERWADVEHTLSELFVLDEENSVWRHKRIDADIAKVKDRCHKNSIAGKKSAEVRRKQAVDSKGDSNERSTTVQPLDKSSTNKEKRVKSKDKNKPSPPTKVDDGQFALFWSNYPKKVDKKQAESKFNSLPWSTQNIAILDCAKRYADTPKQFVPSPRKYILGEKWNDEIIQRGNDNEAHQQDRRDIFDKGTRDAYDS